MDYFECLKSAKQINMVNDIISYVNSRYATTSYEDWVKTFSIVLANAIINHYVTFEDRMEAAESIHNKIDENLEILIDYEFKEKNK